MKAMRLLRARFAALRADLALYRKFIVMQLRAQGQYKANLAIDVGTYLIVTTLEFLTLLVFFERFPNMLGWTVGEVALLFALTSLGFGLAEMIGAGIDQFDQTVRLGEFDRVLLRPVSPLIQIAGSDFRLRRLGRLMQGMMAFALALRLLPPIRWSLARLLIVPLGIASTAAIFLAILLLGATLCFWTVETSELTNIFTYGGRELLSWPFSIYNQTLQRVFLFVVPLAFGSYIPTCFLLGRSLPFGMPVWVAFAAPLVALVFTVAAALVWRVGVFHYQSTGS